MDEKYKNGICFIINIYINIDKHDILDEQSPLTINTYWSRISQEQPSCQCL